MNLDRPHLLPGFTVREARDHANVWCHGLASSAGTTLPSRFTKGMFVGQHGAWNRQPHSGYKVIFVSFANGMPDGNLPVDVLTGFRDEQGRAHGRPVGVALDKRSALLAADDVGNMIWRVTAE